MTILAAPYDLGQAFYEYDETRALVALVIDAAQRVRAQGEAAFAELSVDGGRWRQGETYIFVLDPEGTMLVHPDPVLQGKNVIDLRDINGKPIIRGLIEAATRFADKPEGWYHYEWSVPGAILPRWKSSYVRLVSAPSGKRYVVGSGMYNDRMERAFVVHMVADAVATIENMGEAAFARFRDPSGAFMAKDAYIFVYSSDGVVLCNPAFPNTEGTNLRDVRDPRGTYLIREMLELVKTGQSGWVDYLWPKPGESVSTQKSAYVARASIGDQWVLVGCGVYLAEAPVEFPAPRKMTAAELIALVREAAALFEQQGEKAYAEFRKPGSKWFHDDVYFWALNMDGVRVFLAPDPAGENQNVSERRDNAGRAYGKMALDIARGPSGEGWMHYLFPLPGGMFPAWKSTFVKRVTFPSGKPHAIGCGIYHMQMDKGFIEDVVDRAAALVEQRGKEAFGELRDKASPFVFMDTYVFVDTPDGVELVNPAQPSLEGKNLIGARDVNGKALMREYIDGALRDGSTWVDYYWYKPGQNMPAKKLTYARRVRSGRDTYIVGSGMYVE